MPIPPPRKPPKRYTFPSKAKIRVTLATKDLHPCAKQEYQLLAYRWIRADPPLAKARTCSAVAMVVSPGKVVSSAPCAQPSLTASSGDSPLSRP
jgi:hypothetical protein